MYPTLFASLIASLDIIDISLFTLILPTLHEITTISINDILWIQYSYLLSASISTACLPIISRYCTIRYLIVIGCCAYISGCVIQIYFLQEFWILFFTRMIQGFCIGILNPGSLIILNVYYKGKAFIRATSNYGLIIMLLNALTPMLYGAIIYYYSWRETLIYNVIYCCVLILLSVIPGRITSHVVNNSSFASLLKVKHFFSYLMISCIYYGISISIQIFISVIMQQEKAYEVEYVSFLITLKGIGSCIGFITTPKLLQYFKSRSIGVTCTLITILSYCILYQNNNYAIYETSFLLQGYTLSILNTIFTKNAFQKVPKNLNIVASSVYIFAKFIASITSIELAQNILKY